MIDYSQDIKILAIENAILRKKYDELRKLVLRTRSEIISLELEYEDYGMPWLGNLEIESYSLDELIYHIYKFNTEDRNNILFNLGGVLNHEL